MCPPTSFPGPGRLTLWSPLVPPEQLSAAGMQVSKGRPQGAPPAFTLVSARKAVGASGLPCLSSPEAANTHTKHLSLSLLSLQEGARHGPPRYCLLLPSGESQGPQALSGFSSHPGLGSLLGGLSPTTCSFKVWKSP